MAVVRVAFPNTPAHSETGLLLVISTSTSRRKVHSSPESGLTFRRFPCPTSLLSKNPQFPTIFDSPKKGMLAAKARYDKLAEQLLEPQKEKERAQGALVVDALARSEKTLEEVLTFLRR